MVICTEVDSNEALRCDFPCAEVESVCAHVARAGGSVVYDIVPAAASLGDSGSDLSLPRFVLVGRKINLEIHASDEYQAVFIVSNYSKARYIPSMLYGSMMQLHPNVIVDFVDDGSADDSVAVVEAFKAAFSLSDSLISVRLNRANLGTYWIRNDVVLRRAGHNGVFFVNDSDDCSTALRVRVQLSMLSQSEGYGNFLDIVRVNREYVTAPLNGEVERYGTASLCFTRKLVKRIGSFQVVKKNADTEFIERVRKFIGKNALPWVRYLGLVQPFDGDNLTSDMYQQVSANAFSASLSNGRAQYTQMFRMQHDRIVSSEVSDYYRFPRSTVPDEFSALGPEFLVPGYMGSDKYVVYSSRRPAEEELESWFDLGMNALYVDGDRGVVVLMSSGEALRLRMALPSALTFYAKAVGGRLHLVSRDALNQGPSGEHKSTESTLEDLIYRSKAAGDCLAICEDGATMSVDEAVDNFLGGKVAIIPYSIGALETVGLLREEAVSP